MNLACFTIFWNIIKASNKEDKDDEELKEQNLIKNKPFYSTQLSTKEKTIAGTYFPTIQKFNKNTDNNGTKNANSKIREEKHSYTTILNFKSKENSAEDSGFFNIIKIENTKKKNVEELKRKSILSEKEKFLKIQTSGPHIFQRKNSNYDDDIEKIIECSWN